MTRRRMANKYPVFPRAVRAIARCTPGGNAFPIPSPTRETLPGDRLSYAFPPLRSSSAGIPPPFPNSSPDGAASGLWAGRRTRRELVRCTGPGSPCRTDRMTSCYTPSGSPAAGADKRGRQRRKPGKTGHKNGGELKAVRAYSSPPFIR